MREAIELDEENLAEAIVEWGKSKGWQIDEDSIFIQQDSGDTFAYASLIEPIEPGCEEEDEENEDIKSLTDTSLFDWLYRNQAHSADKTPAEWSELLDIKLLDPDGWRRVGDPPLTQEISFIDFLKRAFKSSVDASSSLMVVKRKK